MSKWAWQQPDWPKFSFQPEVMEAYGRRFVYETGYHSGILKGARQSDRDEMHVEWLASEATASAALDGVKLDRDRMREAVRFALGYTPVRPSNSAAEAAMADFAAETFGDALSPLGHEQLWRWHEQMMRGEEGVKGVYRDAAAKVGRNPAGTITSRRRRTGCPRR